MTEHTRDDEHLAKLFTEITDDAVLTTRRREGASKAVIDTTDGAPDARSADLVVPPSENPLEDPVGDSEER